MSANFHFVRESDLFTQPYCIFIDNFSDDERAEILNTVKPCNATVMLGNNLIMISCKDEATFNWLSLKWQQQ